MSSIRDDRRQADDEGDYTDSECSWADPHDDQGSDRDDRYRLQQEGVRIKHPPDPIRLREDDRHEDTDNDTSEHPPAAAIEVISNDTSKDGNRWITATRTAQGDGRI